MEPLDFLQSVSGFVATQDGGSATRPIKLATIDPAYVASSFPGTLPQVTFDGEGTLSGKFYPVMSPYWPQPGDRVVMVPVGNTYLILGTIEAEGAIAYGNARTSDLRAVQVLELVNFDVGAVDYTHDPSGAVSWAMSYPPSGQVMFVVNFRAQNVTADANLVMGLEIRDNSELGTIRYSPDDNDSAHWDVENRESTATSMFLVTGLPTSGVMFFRGMYKATGGTATMFHRRIIAMPQP